MDNLKKAMAEGDVDTAFRSAHTLKGVCKNLSLQELDKVSSEITEHLRAQDLESAKKMLPAVEEAYDKTIDIIKKQFS